MNPKEHSELLAWLAEAREDYRSMGTGHAGLGGFCISIAARFENASSRIFNPPTAQQQANADGQREAQECNA